jgi:hypothetical protein
MIAFLLEFTGIHWQAEFGKPRAFYCRLDDVTIRFYSGSDGHFRFQIGGYRKLQHDQRHHQRWEYPCSALFMEEAFKEMWQQFMILLNEGAP